MRQPAEKWDDADDDFGLHNQELLVIKMRWIHTNMFIFFIVICILITSGCVSQNKTGNTSGISANATDQTLVQTLCPPIPANATPYIIINPIGDHRVGDIFEINGTTNLGVDEKIKIHMGGPMLSGPHGSVRPENAFFYIEEFVETQPGTCGTTKWSYTFKLPQPYSNMVGVIVENMTVYNQTGFNVPIG